MQIIYYQMLWKSTQFENIQNDQLLITLLLNLNEKNTSIQVLGTLFFKTFYGRNL